MTIPRNNAIKTEAIQCVTPSCRLRILHRFGKTGTLFCSPGEEIWTVLLVLPGRNINLRLSLALRILVDYLARTRHIPQSATQIAAGLRKSPFHLNHGSRGGVPQRRRMSRSHIRVYIKRLRQALEIAFQEAGLPLDAHRFLVSLTTTGNEVLYQLKATVEWNHVEIG